MTRKIVICGSHGVGKSRICEKILTKIWCSKDWYSVASLDEYKHFGGTYDINNSLHIIKDIADFAFIPEQFREVVKDLKYSDTITLKQTEEITLATYAKQFYLENLYTAQGKNILCDRSVLDTFVYYDYFNKYFPGDFIDEGTLRIFTKETYSKIYLLEPSDREIEPDGFRLIDKKQQLEIHELFLEHFKDFSNVEIINQEDAHKPEFIWKVVKEFSL